MDKTLSLLGLARRAGKLLLGHDAALACVKADRAALVMLSSDASARHMRALEGAAYAGPLAALPYTADEIGGAIGKSCCILALEDAGFGAALMKTIREEDIRYVYKD